MRARGFEVKEIKPYIDGLFSGKLCPILRISFSQEKSAWEFMQKYSDHKFSYTDCASFIIMKENNIKKVYSYDKHFIKAGFELAKDE